MVVNMGKIKDRTCEMVGMGGEEEGGGGKWESVIVGGTISGCLDCLMQNNINKKTPT